jgi:hypothetical protein
MQNEQIDGLAINQSLALLFNQQMQALELEEMKLSSKIDLKDVL